MTEVFRPVVLTVAGSDSGGSAGIQADLRAFGTLGTFGTAAITCVTAQNPDGVRSVFPLPADEVLKQIEAVLDGFAVMAAKIGILFSREIIEAVAETASRPDFPRLVVDPVMAATSGAKLLKDDAVASLVERLLPLAAVATPNLDEARILGAEVRRPDEMQDAARHLAGRLGCPVLLKGGHLPGSSVVDALWDGRSSHWWQEDRIDGVNPHGTGCALSAALAARLARGDDLVDACAAAREYVRGALLRPVTLRGGRRLLGGTPGLY